MLFAFVMVFLTIYFYLQVVLVAASSLVQLTHTSQVGTLASRAL